MTINWYPGHMTKARRMILEHLKLVDIVIEILDARIPYSSRNPDFKNLFINKKKILVLNKYDLANKQVSILWQDYYESKDTKIIKVNSKSGEGLNTLFPTVDAMMADKFARDAKRGMKRRPVKAMVCGIPNSGKSTFINKITGSAPAKTGDKPGVTRDRQWIKLHSGLHLLDTPGMLWPKLEDQKVGYNLAMSGAINDEILDLEDITKKLLLYLLENYPNQLTKRYSLDAVLENIDYKNLDIKSLDFLIQHIANSRNYLLKGGEIDIQRTVRVILDEFRAGTLGQISLEEPNDFIINFG